MALEISEYSLLRMLKLFPMYHRLVATLIFVYSVHMCGFLYQKLAKCACCVLSFDCAERWSPPFRFSAPLRRSSQTTCLLAHRREHSKSTQLSSHACVWAAETIDSICWKPRMINGYRQDNEVSPREAWEKVPDLLSHAHIQPKHIRVSLPSELMTIGLRHRDVWFEESAHQCYVFA
jgi:hypothetical protein